jgi:hypothetical protein
MKKKKKKERKKGRKKERKRAMELIKAHVLNAWFSAHDAPGRW